MGAPLQSIVSTLLHESTKTKIPLGDIATSLLECIQSVHSAGLVYIDVKSDNFMLAPVSKQYKTLADRIRLIDFGLVENYNDMTTGRHRIDEEGAALAGTPTYASLNVMSGHTCSRRDDLEALGYVICELIVGLAKQGELPWSCAKSDDELLKMKSLEMDEKKRSKSKLFAVLKGCGADVVMNNYFKEVMGYKYSEAPDYDSLGCYLKKLIVTLSSGGDKRTAAKSPVKNSVRKSPRRVSKQAKDEDPDPEDVVVMEDRKPAAKKTTKSPLRRTTRQAKREESDDDIIVIDSDLDDTPTVKTPKKLRVAAEKAAPRRTARNTTKSSREIATQTDPVDIMDVESEDIEDDADIRNMDWEKIESDENEPPTTAAASRKAKLKIVVVEGPHAGEECFLGGHYSDSIVIGKNPKANSKPSTKDASAFSLSEDEYVSSLHAKLVLTSNKSIHSIKVTDMSSANGTFVGGTALAKGKSKQAFPGNRIKVGDTVLEIKKC